MAQASSAQREPSMEEILASIRRIIEDSDVEKKREPDEAAVIAAPANDVVDRPKGVEAFRTEFRELSPGETSPAEEVASAVQTPPAAAFPEDDWSSQFGSPALRSEPAVEEEGTRPAVHEEKLEPAASGDLDLAVEIAVEDLTEEAAASVETAEVTASASADDSSVDIQPRAALISERAGRQVAAAFGELSEAFAANRRRSFDEMAEEMLRPMLQDWLDNNLPHLVERLVREEIERIARG
jgi:cell pole-organizing protein PopZ